MLEMARRKPGGLGTAPIVAEASEYANTLVRQYLPNFDNYTQKQQAQFLLRTIEQLNRVRKSLESLADHLEYAAPGRKAVPPIKDPDRAIRATILRDVCGWDTRRIGKELQIRTRPGTDLSIKREHKNVGRMIDIGRALLEQCFGAEGWRAKAERMRAARERWESMGPRQQFYTLLAEDQGTSPEEEERVATKDGFDKTLDEWIDALEKDDDEREVRIRSSDPRFDALARLF